MKKKLLSLLMCGALLVGSAIPAFADTFTYTPINGPSATSGDTFQFEKDFQMDKDANVPAATFTYTVAPGTAVNAGTGTAKVLAGVGTPTIANVVYTANEQASANMTVAVDGDVKTATKVAKVDFSSCSFTEPGIYRYIVTEGGTNQGVTNDPIPTRTLDVYVENVDAQAASWEFGGQTYTTQHAVDEAVQNAITDNGTDYEYAGQHYDSLTDAVAAAEADVVATPAREAGLAVTGYVFYEGTKTDAPSTTATTATGKSEGYTNVYDSYDLEFGKEVKGNFGSLDQYFEFTVVLGGMNEGTVLNVDLTDADATPHASDANQVTTAANPTSLTVGADGTVTQKFYIHDGQYIIIKNLPTNATYDITENAHDYTSVTGITAADNDEGVAHADAASGTITDASVKTGYTNTKDVVTPTGIANTLTTFAPAVVIGLVAIAGIVMFSRKKKTNE